MAKEKLPKHVRVGGIEVAVWQNALESGFATVTLHRNYKDKNDNWQKTQSLRVNDIPKAVLALQKAYELLLLRENKS